MKHAFELIDDYALEGRDLGQGHADIANGIFFNWLHRANPHTRIERMRMLNELASQAQRLTSAIKAKASMLEQIQVEAMLALERHTGILVNHHGQAELAALRADEAVGMSGHIGQLSVRRGQEIQRRFMARIAMTSNKPLSAAVHDARSEGLLKAEPFSVSDRTGRRWETGNYIGTSMRSLALQTYVETYLIAASQIGVVQFAVYHENAEHATNGRSFVASDSESIFHPNFRGLPQVADFKAPDHVHP